MTRARNVLFWIDHVDQAIRNYPRTSELVVRDGGDVADLNRVVLYQQAFLVDTRGTEGW